MSIALDQALHNDFIKHNFKTLDDVIDYQLNSCPQPVDNACRFVVFYYYEELLDILLKSNVKSKYDLNVINLAQDRELNNKITRIDTYKKILEYYKNRKV